MFDIQSVYCSGQVESHTNFHIRCEHKGDYQTPLTKAISSESAIVDFDVAGSTPTGVDTVMP